MNPPRWILITIMLGLAVTTISVMGALQDRRLIAPSGVLIETLPVAVQDVEILEPDAGKLVKMGLAEDQVGS